MGHEVSLKKKIRRALLDKILSINVCFRVMEKVKFTDQTEGKEGRKTYHLMSILLYIPSTLQLSQ